MREGGIRGGEGEVEKRGEGKNMREGKRKIVGEEKGWKERESSE